MPTNKYFGKLFDNVNLLPIMGVLVYAGDLGEFTWFGNPEAESSYRFNPIVRPSSKGGDRLVAHSAEVKIYVPHNRYTDDDTALFARLALLKNKRYDVGICLGTQSQAAVGVPEADRTLPINSTAGMWIDFGLQLMMTYEVESVEYRPRLILTFKGLVMDLLNQRTAGDPGSLLSLFK